MPLGDYIVNFVAGDRSAHRAAKALDEDLDQVGETARTAGEQSAEASSSIGAALQDARVQAGLLLAVLDQIRDAMTDIAERRVSFLAESRGAGMTQDEAQAIAAIGRTGAGLEPHEAVRDVRDLLEALYDRAGEVAADPRSSYTFDFEAAGIDPARLQGLDTLGALEYLQQAVPPPGQRSLEQAGALDRLVAGDKRALDAVTNTLLTMEQARAHAAQIPDVTAAQETQMQQQMLDRLTQDEMIAGQSNRLFDLRGLLTGDSLAARGLRSFAGVGRFEERPDAPQGVRLAQTGRDREVMRRSIDDAITTGSLDLRPLDPGQ